MTVGLQDLGFSKEEIESKVVKEIADRVLNRENSDEWDEVYIGDTEFKGKIDELVKARIHQSVEVYAKKAIYPNMTKIIESLVLRNTNQYGEEKGAPMTFCEYMVKKADEFMNKPVNKKGQTQEEATKWNGRWEQHSTRAAWLIEQEIDSIINKAGIDMIEKAKKALDEGMLKTFRDKIQEFTNNMSIVVDG